MAKGLDSDDDLTDEGLSADHPGDILRRQFLEPLALSSNALAMALRVPTPRITELVRGRRGVTADTALRLARYFETSPDFWLAAQAAFDLAEAEALAGADIVSGIEPRQIENKTLRKLLHKAVRRRADALKDRI